jgi:anaerobic selenocysteine-containing dehydrogenase
LYSETLKQWGWPEYVLPGYIRSQVHRHSIKRDQQEFVLVPTFRLPTLIHTRSANAKWLNEIAHRNPVWMNPKDASDLGVASGDLIRVSTAIGYMVNRVWVTDSMAPGVVACSHHLGRWRINEKEGSRWASPRVAFQQTQEGILMRQVEPYKPFKSSDRDTQRIWWSDGGVHQNMAFPIQPDPVSGNNCWHQKVKVERAWSADKYGDVFVNPSRAKDVLSEWLEKTRPAAGPLRRPEWLNRPFRPAPEMFRFDET